MALNTLSAEQLTINEIAAIQAALPNAFNIQVGSIIRALVDADVTTALWLESLIQYVQSTARLSTSTGADINSFLADFDIEPQAALYATGDVVFSRFTATQQAVVPVGTGLETTDSTISFKVTRDVNNSSYNAALDGYIIAANTANSLPLPVKANAAGTIGNVIANAITVITSPVPNVDTVTNPLAFSNGADNQTDAAKRAYFVAYLNSLSKATKDAIAYAIINADPGILIEYNLVENTNYTTGLQQLGYFYAVIDDGTGNPTAGLINAVKNSIEVYRGLTIQYDVFAVTTLTANISATVSVPASYYGNTSSILKLQADIQNALMVFLDELPIGATLYFTRIGQIIYNVIANDAPSLIGQINVTSITLNSGTSNLVATPKESIYPGTINITIVSQ